MITYVEHGTGNVREENGTKPAKIGPRWLEHICKKSVDITHLNYNKKHTN